MVWLFMPIAEFFPVEEIVLLLFALGEEGFDFKSHDFKNIMTKKKENIEVVVVISE